MIENKKELKLGCIVMASGQASRFGSNKLLEPLFGGTVIEYTLSSMIDIDNEIRTDGRLGLVVDGKKLIEEPLVVTRSREIADICFGLPVNCVVHNGIFQSDTIRHGLCSQFNDNWDGCMFLAADQPLLKRQSMIKLAKEFHNDPSKAYRLGYGGLGGNPVIFPAKYFNDLCRLKGDKGGGFVLAKRGVSAEVVEAGYSWELKDVDTRKDLEYVKSIIYANKKARKDI